MWTHAARPRRPHRRNPRQPVMVIPVYLITVNALKSTPEASSMSMAWPSEIHLENFLTVIDKGKLITSFLNSVLYASAVDGARDAACCDGGLRAVAAPDTRLNRFLYFFLIMGIALPINFFTLTTMMQVTHLINTKIGIIILYAATADSVLDLPHLRLHRDRSRASSTKRRSSTAAARSSCSSASSCRCSSPCWSPPAS